MLTMLWVVVVVKNNLERFRGLRCWFSQRVCCLCSVGLLCANLVGFHVYDYLRHFISSCVQLLGLENTAQGKQREK